MIIMLYAFGVGIIRIIFSCLTTKRAQNKTREDSDMITFELQETLSQYIESKGTVWNLITYTMAILSEMFTEIIHFMFAVCSFVAVFAELFGMSPQHYAQAKGLAMLLGWIIIPILFKTYSPFYTFVVILKHIFIRCVIPYILFYVFLVVAFGSAVQLQFQLLSDTGAKSLVTEDDNDDGAQCEGVIIPNYLKRVRYVVWQLCIMTVSLDSKLKDLQSIGNVLHKEGLSTLYVEGLLFFHGVLSVILILNMLIAAMNTTYSDVIVKQAKGWRQYQVPFPVN